VNQDFKQCLESGKIVPFPKGKELVKKELSVAQSDLLDAKAGYESKRYKWSIIQGYYAMFHAARALLYKDGIQEKSHYAISVYLKEKYSSKIPLPIINFLEIHRTERHEAIYGFEYKPKKEDAELAIKDAETFIKEIKEILLEGNQK
jgi:uncharacterized protein (UPF0332 family)